MEKMDVDTLAAKVCEGRVPAGIYILDRPVPTHPMPCTIAHQPVEQE